MRTITGFINLPGNCPVTSAKRVLVEIRDTSLQDVSSVVMASKVLENVAMGPNQRIAFELDVAEAAPRTSLSLRVHIDITGNNTVETGDLLTTRSYPVPHTGDTTDMEIAVRLI